MEILIVCPANCATGGPEALHEFASGLNKVNGVHARLWYWNSSGADPMPAEYRRYGCEYVTEMPDNYRGVLIVPEIYADHVADYQQCTRAIWWLGLDAYAHWSSNPGAFLRDDGIIHITQSEYAFDLLNKLGAKRILRCTDTVNADFYADYDEMDRGDAVLYNPAKATPFMRELMRSCPGIEFKPIKGMSRAEVIDTMRHSKLYVDFGEFPGRERMPREAALCGCCLITSKVGSAAYWMDFPHTYKFDSKTSHIWAIRHKIRYVLDHYEECRTDFDFLRDTLRDDIRRIKNQRERLMDEVQHYHTGT